METRLTEIALRNGQRADVLCIEPPAPEWRDRIAPFLAHKGAPWFWHVADHLDGNHDELEQRFYVAVIDETIVSEMMVVEKYGLAILGHVFTDPAWREQGATTALMGVMTDAFIARDGVAMHLRTGFETQPFRIYSRFGFEPITPGWGFMRWIRHQDRFDAFFAADKADDVHVERACWTHWPLVHKLMLREEGDWLRWASMGLAGLSNAEDEFVYLMHRSRTGPPHDSAVLVNAAGMTVGLATLLPYTALPSRMLEFDVYAHPTAYGHLRELIDAVPLPDDRPVTARIDADSPERYEALTDAGFREIGHIKDALHANDGDIDLVLLQR